LVQVPIADLSEFDAPRAISRETHHSTLAVYSRGSGIVLQEAPVDSSANSLSVARSYYRLPPRRQLILA
jgi:hypothetical protein